VIVFVYSPGDQRIDRELGGVSETFFRPAFRKIPSDIDVPEGSMARFDCIVVGRPNPDVYWFRDGAEVLEDRLHKIVINEDGISSLIFDATSRSDTGHYTCIARNRAGEDRFEVNLNVTRTYSYFILLILIVVPATSRRGGDIVSTRSVRTFRTYVRTSVCM